MQIVIAVVVLYMLYRFVMGFLIPVIHTTRKIKKQFNDLRNNMNPDEDDSNNENDFNEKTYTQYKPKKEYIEFEDVK